MWFQITSRYSKTRRHSLMMYRGRLCGVRLVSLSRKVSSLIWYLLTSRCTWSYCMLYWMVKSVAINMTVGSVYFVVTMSANTIRKLSIFAEVVPLLYLYTSIIGFFFFLFWAGNLATVQLALWNTARVQLVVATYGMECVLLHRNTFTPCGMHMHAIRKHQNRMNQLQHKIGQQIESGLKC